MLTVQFKNLRDEQPIVGRNITYLVAKNPFIMVAGGFECSGEFYTGVCEYDWHGVTSYGANSLYLDGDTCSKYPLGYEGKFLDEGVVDENDEYETFRKVMMLSVDGKEYSSIQILPFNSEDECDDKDIEILWEYTHKIRYEACSQTPLGGNTFPTPFIKELLEDEMISIVGEPVFQPMEQDGYKYKHVTLVFNWLGNLWVVSGSQHGEWSEDAWIDGKYADMFIYRVTKLGETGNDNKGDLND